MGGAPSRETLKRGIVREPRPVAGATTPVGDASAASQLPPRTQSEVVLIPLISDYFPSASCPLFQQVLEVRREPSVLYYTRDQQMSGATSVQSVMPATAGSDAEIYNYYMTLSEQRLVEADSDLVALHRIGRAYTPVPCAVAFVYDPASSLPATGAPASSSATPGPPPRGGSRKTRKSASAAVGGASKGSAAGGEAAGAGNGSMTLENTVRLPRQNIRVRIFGCIGDARSRQPFLLPAFANKSPMRFGMYLSKSAGGNHRTQVTLLAAYTYVTQLRQAGVLPDGFDLWRGDAGTAAPSGHGVQGDGANGNGIGPQGKHLSSSPTTTTTVHNVDAFEDAYGSAYDGGETVTRSQSGSSLALHTLSGAVDDAARCTADHTASQEDDAAATPHDAMTNAAAVAGAGGRSGGADHRPLDQDELQTCLHPINFAIHRSDVPALCFLRELRYRIREAAASAFATASTASTTPATSTVDAEQTESAQGGCANSLRPSQQEPSSTLAQPLLHSVSASAIATWLQDGALTGFISPTNAAELIMWCAEYYVRRFDSLVGGEATRMRSALAQRNLVENAIDGQLFVAARVPEDTRPVPSANAPEDVWITTGETFIARGALAQADRALFRSLHDDHVEALARGPDDGEAAAAGDADGKHDAAAGGDRADAAPRALVEQGATTAAEQWLTLPTGTVLRRVVTIDGWQWRVRAADRGREYVEDLLLTMCRGACNNARRAPPMDPHWVTQLGSSVPEGASQGILIWHDDFKGQNIFYATTPDFLKKWMKAGKDPVTAFNQLLAGEPTNTEHSVSSATEVATNASSGGDTTVSGAGPQPRRTRDASQRSDESNACSRASNGQPTFASRPPQPAGAIGRGISAPTRRSAAGTFAAAARAPTDVQLPPEAPPAVLPTVCVGGAGRRGDACGAQDRQDGRGGPDTAAALAAARECGSDGAFLRAAHEPASMRMRATGGVAPRYSRCHAQESTSPQRIASLRSGGISPASLSDDINDLYFRTSQPSSTSSTSLLGGCLTGYTPETAYTSAIPLAYAELSGQWAGNAAGRYGDGMGESTPINIKAQSSSFSDRGLSSLRLGRHSPLSAPHASSLRRSPRLAEHWSQSSQPVAVSPSAPFRADASGAASGASRQPRGTGANPGTVLSCSYTSTNRTHVLSSSLSAARRSVVVLESTSPPWLPGAAEPTQSRQTVEAAHAARGAEVTVLTISAAAAHTHTRSPAGAVRGTDSHCATPPFLPSDVEAAAFATGVVSVPTPDTHMQQTPPNSGTRSPGSLHRHYDAEQQQPIVRSVPPSSSPPASREYAPLPLEGLPTPPHSPTTGQPAERPASEHSSGNRTDRLVPRSGSSSCSLNASCRNSTSTGSEDRTDSSGWSSGAAALPHSASSTNAGDRPSPSGLALVRPSPRRPWLSDPSPAPAHTRLVATLNPPCSSASQPIVLPRGQSDAGSARDAVRAASGATPDNALSHSSGSSYRQGSARSSVGNGRYRWDWRASSSSIKSALASSGSTGRGSPETGTR